MTSDQPSRYTENAVYGDLTWNPVPAWSFTVGARVARNRQCEARLAHTTGPGDRDHPVGAEQRVDRGQVGAPAHQPGAGRGH